MDIQKRLPAQDLSVPVWPLSAGASVIFLLDARDRFEAQILESWARERTDGALIEATFVRLRTRQTNQRLHAALQGLDDPQAFGTESIWLQPLRVAWFGAERRGTGLLQDLFHGRTTHPGPIKRRWLARYEPDRLRCISGQGAGAADLRSRFEDRAESGKPDQKFAAFIRDQALLDLERAERLARGARYKIPRLIPHEVFADPDFRELMRDVAKEQGISRDKAYGRAERYLCEMGASQTPFTLELLTALYRAGVRSNHDPNIDVNADQLAQIAALISSRPVVYVITHKSILDTVSFSLVLFDANLPVPMTFGGLNLGTFGVGAFARRAGIIFLRRSFQDNPIYKGTFRRYIDYLIEKRFSVIWALEGTRSRTGKLLPPRYGLFNYVVESVLRTGLHDLAFVPVSVAYDQITEVEDYAIEQRGNTKQAEGAGWMLRFFKRGSSHGRIFVRFGDPVSLPDIAGDTPLTETVTDEQRFAWVQDLARRCALRMNAVTPVTATAVVTLVLLASGRRAQRLEEIRYLTRSAAIEIRRNGIELVGQTDFKNEQSLVATIAQLHATGIVSYFDEGVERLYNVQPEQHHKAAYYRNTAIHYFIHDAIVEVALLRAAESSVSDRVAEFIRIAEGVRNTLRQDFYFAEGESFRATIEKCADARFKEWRQFVNAGPDAVVKELTQIRLLFAHGVLRSFIDAYRVVAEVLVIAGPQGVDGGKDTLSGAMRLGKQQLQLDQVFSPEAVSKVLYQTALKRAGEMELLGADKVDQRRRWHDELAGLTDALDQILRITVRKAQIARVKR